MPADALAEVNDEPHNHASHIGADSVAAVCAESIVGRVSRLEKGGRVVAIAAGQEIIVQGVQVWKGQCLYVRVLWAAARDQPQVIICATGYEYSFPFLKRSDDCSDGDHCLDGSSGGVNMSWDRYMVEPL